MLEFLRGSKFTVKYIILFIFIFLCFAKNSYSSSFVDKFSAPISIESINKDIATPDFKCENNLTFKIEDSNGIIIPNQNSKGGGLIYRDILINTPYTGKLKYYLVDENKTILEEGEVNINYSDDDVRFTISFDIPHFYELNLPKKLFLIYTFDRGILYNECFLYYEPIYVIKNESSVQNRIIYNLIQIYNDLENQINALQQFLYLEEKKIGLDFDLLILNYIKDQYIGNIITTVGAIFPYTAPLSAVYEFYHLVTSKSFSFFGLNITPQLIGEYVDSLQLDNFTVEFKAAVESLSKNMWNLIKQLTQTSVENWDNIDLINKVENDFMKYIYVVLGKDVCKYAYNCCNLEDKWIGLIQFVGGDNNTYCCDCSNKYLVKANKPGVAYWARADFFIYSYLISLIKKESIEDLEYGFCEYNYGTCNPVYSNNGAKYFISNEDYFLSDDKKKNINEMIFGKVAQPEIISMDTPTVVQKGNIAKIIVRAKNNSSKDAVYGSITVSFPYLSSLSGINVENNAGLNVYRREVGDSIYNNMCKPMVAKYPVIELGGSWKKGEEKDVTIDIDSSQISVNELYLYIRSTMTSYGNPWCYYKNDPASGNILDQQNWKVYKKVIRINNPPNKPMVVKGPTSGYVDKVYYFSVSDSDPDGDDIVYKFDWGDGHISSYSSNTQYHFWTKAGKYCIRVKAKDKYGAESEWSDYYCIDIANNASPTCYFVNIDINPASGGSVSINPHKSCYNGDRVTLTATPNNGYKFSGWGGDCSFCGSSTSCTITVSSNKNCTADFELSSNEPPVIDSFTANPTSGSAPLTVTFTCSAHDPDGNVVEYDIDYRDGNTEENEYGTFTHTYNNSGSYKATCTVKDNDGSVASKSIQISVGFTSSYTFTPGNDTNYIQNKNLSILDAGKGDDTYIIDPQYMTDDLKVTVIDYQGNNIIRIPNGTEFKEIKVAKNAIEFILENGAVVKVLDADHFHFQLGGDESTGEGSTDQTFEEFVTDSLKLAQVPQDNEHIADVKGEMQIDNNVFRLNSANNKKNYIGCFKDKGNAWGVEGRDLSGFMTESEDMTVEKCIQICSEKGFKYAGLQYGIQCFCGNSYGKYGESTNCNYKCSGNQSEICGGVWANSVYSVKKSNTNSHDKNVIMNAGFEYGLEDWSFEDISHTGSQCTGYTAVSNVSVDNNTAVIHSKYGYGRGKLSQSFDPVKPVILSVSYKAASPHGHCNTVIIYFYDSQGTKIAGLYYGEDSFVPQYSRLIITLLGNDYTLPFNSKYSEGTIEFSFDWDNKKVSAIWHSNTGEEEVLETAPIENDVYVSKVDLMAYNSCCDGRDDAYGYFKDVVVQQYSANASYNSNIGAARKLKCKYAIGYTVFFHTL